jgi:hypothetical protein
VAPGTTLPKEEVPAILNVEMLGYIAMLAG